jgi:hypothetical protein
LLRFYNFYIKLPEILLHYIWQNQIWSGYIQQTTDGRHIEIISTGQHNRDAGPDFIAAHIRIDGQVWVGNIEIHVHASDWNKHKHHLDPAYDNTILHVVGIADKEVVNSRGEKLVQCELQYPREKDYVSQLLHAAITENSLLGKIQCRKQLQEDPNLLTKGWKKVLLEKRLACKRKSIEQLLQITRNSWTHAFYISLAHNFGFHTNGLPFEQLALQTPLSCLQKHRNSLFQITAILLGQSGLLDEIHSEEALKQEYNFLKKKFSLTPIDASLWKKGRMRPHNTPEVRIRQFAHLMYQSEFMFAKLMDANCIGEMTDILTLRYSDEETYARVKRPLPLGKKSIDILLINTVLPYKYAYSIAQQNISNLPAILHYMEQIPKEENAIIKQWAILGQKLSSAADTQALIHLYQNYCQPHMCYNCHVGYQVFAQKELDLF